LSYKEFLANLGLASEQADEDISYLARVHDEGDAMSYAAHGRDFGLSGDRAAPVASGIGAKLARVTRLLTDAHAAQRQREVDREIALLLARSGGRITDGMEREIMEKALVSDWRLPQ
jgi:hypothetical protein